MRLNPFLAILTAFALTGCVTTTPRAVFVAPDLIQYSPEQQAKVASELEACADKCSETTGFINDYGNLREAIRETATD